MYTQLKLDTVTAIFETQVRRTPHGVAVVHHDQQLTYRELNARANQLARYLNARGVGTGQLVAIALERSLDLITSILGVLKAGAAYIPLDSTLPKDRIISILSDANPTLLTTQKLAAELGGFSTHSVLCIDQEREAIAQESGDNLTWIDNTAHDLAYVIYTSGSTGVPKGVMVEHCSVANYAEVASTQYEVKVGDRILQCCSISFDAAVEEIFCTFAQGATLVLRSEDMLSTAAFFLEECQRLKITVLFIPTAFWHFITAALLQFDLVLPKTLRLISMGGERALPERFAIWRDRVGSSVRLINGYGPTEATVVATMSDLSHLDQMEGELPIGTPISGVEAYVLDDSLNPVPTGQVGELYLGGVAIARGYLNQPQLTAERFISNPFDDDRSRLYRTGDLVRYRDDQQLEYVGRVDHQVKVAGGFRVELFEIEMLLTQHPLVQEAVVVATNQGSDSKRLVAYVVFRSASSTEALSDLRSHLKSKLPPYMIPSVFVPLKSLPLTPIGKVDRRKLASEVVPAVERHNQTTARNPIEAQLIDIFSDLLLQDVGVDDNFFDLGGNSLLAAQAIAQVSEIWQVQVFMRQFYEAPSAAGLAQTIVTAQQCGSVAALSTLNLGAEAEFSFHPDLNKPIRRSEETNCIFLTGATGFLGAFLLHELLQTTPATVYCLVRCMSSQDGLKKVRDTLTNYLIWHDSYGDRICIIPGDLTKPQLGLSDAEFAKLAAQIESIYHSGAVVDFVKPYSILKTANVIGTQEILRLSSTGSTIKPLHYISTIGVFGPVGYFTGKPQIGEEVPLGISESFMWVDDGYAQSKWVAEQIVRSAQLKGLPIHIFRPGFIVGHSQTGVTNTKDYISRLIIGCIQLGCAPELVEQKDQMVTIDYVSQAIVHLSRQNTTGKTFHLTPPPGEDLTTSELYDLIRTFGYPLESVSYLEWKTRLLESTPANPLYPLLPLLTEQVHEGQTLIELYQHCPDYDSSNTIQGLANTSIAFSSIKPKILETYLPYFVHFGFLDEPC